MTTSQAQPDGETTFVCAQAIFWAYYKFFISRPPFPSSSWRLAGDIQAHPIGPRRGNEQRRRRRRRGSDCSSSSFSFTLPGGPRRRENQTRKKASVFVRTYVQVPPPSPLLLFPSWILMRNSLERRRRRRRRRRRTATPNSSPSLPLCMRPCLTCVLKSLSCPPFHDMRFKSFLVCGGE